MTKKIILSLMGLIFSITVFSQKQVDTIKAIKIRGGYIFERGKQELSMKDMTILMKTNIEAYEYIRTAEENQKWCMVFQCIGGGLIGYPLGTAITGGKPNLTLAAIGGGVLLIAVPINMSANRNALRAVDIYNSKKRKLSYNEHYKLNLGLKSNGIGLVLNF